MAQSIINSWQSYNSDQSIIKAGKVGELGRRVPKIQVLRIGTINYTLRERVSHLSYISLSLPPSLPLSLSISLSLSFTFSLYFSFFLSLFICLDLSLSHKKLKAYIYIKLYIGYEYAAYQNYMPIANKVLLELNLFLKRWFFLLTSIFYGHILICPLIF